MRQCKQPSRTLGSLLLGLPAQPRCALLLVLRRRAHHLCQLALLLLLCSGGRQQRGNR